MATVDGDPAKRYPTAIRRGGGLALAGLVVAGLAACTSSSGKEPSRASSSPSLPMPTQPPTRETSPFSPSLFGDSTLVQMNDLVTHPGKYRNASVKFQVVETDAAMVKKGTADYSVQTTHEGTQTGLLVILDNERGKSGPPRTLPAVTPDGPFGSKAWWVRSEVFTALKHGLPLEVRGKVVKVKPNSQFGKILPSIDDPSHAAFFIEGAALELPSGKISSIPSTIASEQRPPRHQARRNSAEAVLLDNKARRGQGGYRSRGNR